MISPLLSQTAARGIDRLDKPRESHPESGMRFTSQIDRGHDGTLDELAIRPVNLIQVGGSGIKSGALVTARLTLAPNRNVSAIPGTLCNPMALQPPIKTSQATLVTTFKDICDDLAPGGCGHRATEVPDPR